MAAAMMALAVALAAPVGRAASHTGALAQARSFFLETVIADGGLSEWTTRAELFHAFPPAPALLPGSVPLMLETRFNPAAVDYIEEQGMHRPQWRPDRGNPAAPLQSFILPSLPSGASAVMMAWWPVASDAPTPLPIWTAGEVARSRGSNGFLSWPRLFAIRTGADGDTGGRLAFAGRFRSPDGTVSLSRFHSRTLSAGAASAWMQQAPARKLSAMVLGRELRAGDALALVAMHVVMGDGALGTWGTLWWGDARSGGARLGDRGPASAYRIDAVRDSILPRETDGSPRRCFNPWLEGGLADAGAGNGLQSNCISCHSRAAYPARGFLQVTRGAQAPADGSLPTAMLWSPALAHRSPGGSSGR
jgi:hypothetical protein